MCAHKPRLLIGLVATLLIAAANADDMPAMSRSEGLRQTIIVWGDEQVYTILKQSVAVHGDMASAWVYVHKKKNIVTTAGRLTEQDLRLNDATKNDSLLSLAFMAGLDQGRGLPISAKPTDKQVAGVLVFSLAAERVTPETEMLVEVYLPNRTARIKQVGGALTHDEFISPPPGSTLIAIAACITTEAQALGLLKEDQ